MASSTANGLRLIAPFSRRFLTTRLMKNDDPAKHDNRSAASRRPSANWPIALGFVLFAIPAVIGLADQAWQSEAGSLAPIILALAGWTLWHACRAHPELRRAGRRAIWLPAMVAAILAMIVGSALGFAALMALSAWVAGVAALYAALGGAVLRKAALPVLLLAMVVPLPYVLSMHANAVLRDGLSHAAVASGAALGLDVALDQGAIAVDQYLLLIENACAGANSTLSLIAIGVLLAYWIGAGSKARILTLSLLAIPIALLANLGRVVALMGLTSWVGVGVLETAIHPLSGILSFTFALGLLLMAARLVDFVPAIRRG